jgi:riboflavin biosynthesis pyrimidine reductase
MDGDSTVTRASTRIDWRPLRPPDDAVVVGSPDPLRWASLGFPSPWPDRPWVFGVMVASANGVVAWRRRGPTDHPVLEILGGEHRCERIADRRHMRFLRAVGDAAVGAQTVRDQPSLVLTPQEPGDEPAPELYRLRTDRGLSHHPRNIVYSLFGRLPLEHPMFNTPGLRVIVITTEAGAAELAVRGVHDKDVSLVVEPTLDADRLRWAHQRLQDEHGVRYLGCEGGETVLRALHAAGVLDEVFVTVTDVVVDESAHEGVLKIMDLRAEGAELIAEGKIAPDSGFAFQRWRFSPRDAGPVLPHP